MLLRRRWTFVCALSAALSGIGAEIFGLASFIPPLVGVGGWFALAVDVGPFSRVFGVDLEPLFNIELCIGNDGLDRTFRFAVAAIDTLVGMDDQHVLALVEAILGANHDTVLQFALDTALGDDIGHGPLRREPAVLITELMWIRRECVATLVPECPLVAISGLFEC